MRTAYLIQSTLFLFFMHTSFVNAQEITSKWIQEQASPYVIVTAEVQARGFNPADRIIIIRLNEKAYCVNDCDKLRKDMVEAGVLIQTKAMDGGKELRWKFTDVPFLNLVHAAGYRMISAQPSLTTSPAQYVFERLD